MARSARLATSYDSSNEPESFLAAIHRALEEGSLEEARRIAEEGAAKFSGHEELERKRRLLQPGKAVSVARKNAPSRRRAFERLDQEASRLRGKWVALSADDIVATADTLDDLLAIVRPMNLEHPPLVHLVA